VGKHCKNSSPCCCLSSSWLIYPTRIASFAMRRLLVDSVWRRGATLPGCVTVQRWLAVAYFAHPVYLQYA
jgi:hypothetical protein